MLKDGSNGVGAGTVPRARACFLASAWALIAASAVAALVAASRAAEEDDMARG